MARIIFLMDEMFEDSEFQIPYDRLKEEMHDPLIVGLDRGKTLIGKQDKVAVKVEVSISDISPDDADAVVIPGGYSPDRIRADRRMVDFVKAVHDAGKPTAAVCHAGWMLAEADVLHGRTVTSWPSIKTDLVNAGAYWVDQEVVEDGNLITSRGPEDLDAFTKAILVQLERAA